jgi:hypothetical protein
MTTHGGGSDRQIRDDMRRIGTVRYFVFLFWACFVALGVVFATILVLVEPHGTPWLHIVAAVAALAGAGALLSALAGLWRAYGAMRKGH